MAVTVKLKNQKTVKKKIRSCGSRIRMKTKWLATPQDWAEFDEWAKCRARPKRLFCPEPINRCKKPLRCIINRLRCLARPKRDFGDNQWVFRVLCSSVLNFKASARLKRLANPKCLETDQECREWGVIESALCYEPTPRILELSQPKKRPVPDDCKSKVIRVSLTYKTTEKTELLAKPKKCKGCVVQCITRKIKLYPKGQEPRLSAWIDFLALPSYRHLKDQTSEMAIQMKARILDETDIRPKQAYKEQMHRRRKRTEPELEGEGEEQEETEEQKRKRRIKKDPWRFTDSKCGQFPPPISKSAQKYKATALTIDLAKPLVRQFETCRKDDEKKNQRPKSPSAFPRLKSLSTPKFRCEPVKQASPRTYDEFGKPILIPPPSIRILPKTPPYPLAKCDKVSEKQSKTTVTTDEVTKAEKAAINLALAATIDPMYDPVGARRQARIRRQLKPIIEKNIPYLLKNEPICKEY